MKLDPPLSARGMAVAVALALVAIGVAGLGDVTLATAAAQASPSLVAVGLFVTGFGTSGYMFVFSGLIALAAILALGRGHAMGQGASPRGIAERAVYFFLAIAASGLLANIVKHVVGRARPKLLTAEGAFNFHVLSMHDLMASFPSGHTTSAFAAAVALGYMKPGWRGWLLGAAALIGASRVLVGAHYPSDVVAGAALGSAVSVALARAFRRRGLAFAARRGRVAAAPRRPDPAGSMVQN